MTDRPKSPLERFLNLFAEVKGGEGASAVLLTVNIFLILASYYIIKPVRDALIIASGSPELKSYMSAGQTLLLLGIVPLYAMLASALPRKRLLNVVTLFFTACLVGFYALAVTRVPIGVIFFLWAGIFNVSVIAQFWSFANDLYTPGQGKRLFAIVAFGASAGAVAGPLIARFLNGPAMGRWLDGVTSGNAFFVYSTEAGPLIQTELLLIPAGILLLLSLVFTNIVDAREQGRAAAGGAVETEPLPKGNPYRLVFGKRYLLLIALLILTLNWVNTTGEYILDRVVESAAEAAADEAGIASTLEGQDPPEERVAFRKSYITDFKSGFFGIVNIVGLLVQLFAVSRILKYMGVRIALFILPVIAMGGYILAAFFPVLGLIRWTKTAENATDYSLQNTLRGVLFLPTTREEKYKAKQAIDTIFVRAGDVLSAALVYAGTTWLAFRTEHFAMVNLIFVVGWLILAGMIGREYLRQTREAD